jgi:hypothetical protein
METLSRYELLRQNPEAYKKHLERNREYKRKNPDKLLEHNRRYRRKEEVRIMINRRNMERYYGKPGGKERIARNSKSYRGSLQGYMRSRIRAAFWTIRSGCEGRYMKMMDAINGKKGHINSISQTHVTFVIPLAHFDLSNSVQLRKALHHTNIIGMEIEKLMVDQVQRPFVMEQLPFEDNEDALFEAESFIRRCKTKVNYED